MHNEIRLKNKHTVSELPYINGEFVYEIKAKPWQTIRPSFLVFLNYAMPANSSSWNEPAMLQMAEVGVAGGLNSALMLSAYKYTFLYLIDPYELGQGPEGARELLKPYEARTKFIRKRSIDAAKEYPDQFFDYVYIDGSHDYKDVLDDMIAWFPKVKYSGIMAGHDWWFDDVRRAVGDFLQKDPQRLYGVQRYFGEGESTKLSSDEAEGMDWWFVKRQAIHVK